VPLLVTIALNAARDGQRKRQRRPEELRADIEAAAGSGTPKDDTLLQAVQLLPAPEREAILLHYVLDLALTDVARILQKRTGAVKSILHRGRAHLRAMLEAEEGMADGR